VRRCALADWSSIFLLYCAGDLIIGSLGFAGDKDLLAKKIRIEKQG
jgi:hypothetical protein